MTPRRIAGALGACLVAASAAGAQDTAPDAAPAPARPAYEQLIGEARDALARREFDRARELFRLALGAKPESVEARDGQAAAEDDDYWYGRRPIEFRIPVREDWQRSRLARTGNPVLQSLDPRLGAQGDVLGTGDVGYRQFASAGRTDTGQQRFTGAVSARNVGQPAGGLGRRPVGGGPIISTVNPDRRGPTTTIRHVDSYRGGQSRDPFSGRPAGPAAPVRTNQGGFQPARDAANPVAAPGRTRAAVGDVGIAAAFLGFVLPYVYEYAVPLDLTLEPLASSRAAGFGAMFGFAPMRGAATMNEGLWKVGLTYSNWFGTMEKEGQFLSGTAPGKAAPVPVSGSFYRYRKNRFDEGVVQVEYGLGWGIELSGGFTIASLHEGHTRADRNEIVFNRDGYVHVAEVSRAANMGNLTLGARWGMPWGGEGDLFSGVGAALDLKVPIGDPDDFATSGTFDAALTAIVTQVVLSGERPLYLHLNAGVMMPFGDDGFFEHPPVASTSPAPPKDDEVEARPALFYGLGVSWKIAAHVVVLAGFEGNASPYDAGSGNPDGLGSGSFGVADGLAFTAHLGVRVLFDKLFFEGSIGHDLGLGDVHGMTGRVSIALFFGGSGSSSGGAAPTRFAPSR